MRFPLLGFFSSGHHEREKMYCEFKIVTMVHAKVFHGVHVCGSRLMKALKLQHRNRP